MTITQDLSEPFWENSSSRLRALCARLWTGAMYLGALLTLAAGDLSAQQTAVCSDTPGEGERIECTEAADSSNGITLSPTGIDIDTMGENASGVYGRHEGSGNIEFGAQNTHITTAGGNAHGFHGFIGYRPADPPTEDPLPAAAGDIVIVVGGSTIETAGSNSGGVFAENYGGSGLIDVRMRTSTIKTKDRNGYGIFGLRGGTGSGDVKIDVSGTCIETEGSNAFGIYGRANSGAPKVVIKVERGTIITTGRSADGVRGYRQDNDGLVDIDVLNTDITTSGDRARGIDAYVFQSDGDIDIFVEDSHVTTMGEQRAPGIRARYQDGQAGDVLVIVRGGSVTTHGAASFVGNDDSGRANTSSGLEVTHEGNAGDITVDVRDVDITTEGTAILTDQIGTLSHGIYSRHNGNGEIDIEARGGSIETKGSYSYGIYGTHAADGDITIQTGDGHTITTTGDNAHGIVGYHLGTGESRTVDITVGGSIEAGGPGADGVRVGGSSGQFTSASAG